MVRKSLVAGVDIGGTKTAVVLAAEPFSRAAVATGGAAPSILTRGVFATRPAAGPEPAIRSIVEALRQALASPAAAEGSLRAIGVSCGSPLDAKAGVIQEPPNLATWKDVPITSILGREFGVPCFLENDANAGAMAEHAFGGGRGTRNLVFLTMGTGFGAGLIVEGELYRGASDAAGEIGHVRLSATGPIGYHKAGSVEGWASGGGMAKVAKLRMAAAAARGQPTLLAEVDGREVTARDVAEAAERGDVLAGQIIRATGRRLGQALAIVVDVLNPECILVGGLALRLGESLLGPARAVVAREALAGSAGVCRIAAAELGESIGDVAALCVAVAGDREDAARKIAGVARTGAGAGAAL